MSCTALDQPFGSTAIGPGAAGCWRALGVTYPLLSRIASSSDPRAGLQSSRVHPFRLVTFEANARSEFDFALGGSSLSRRFRITEGTRLEILGEAFNLFNRTQVTTVTSTFYNYASNTTTPACPGGLTQCLIFNDAGNAPFLNVTGADSTLFRERQIQFAARFEF